MFIWAQVEFFVYQKGIEKHCDTVPLIMGIGGSGRVSSLAKKLNVKISVPIPVTRITKKQKN